MMLDDNTIREMLPAGVRVPIFLGGYRGGFSANGIPASVPKPQGPGPYGSYAPGTGNANTADMTADGLHSRFPYLLFSVSGALGLQDVGLDVVAADGSSLRTAEPLITANESWKEALVGTPPNDFSLHAHDESRERWFAFLPPVELGRLSYWTHLVLDASPLLILLSLLATGFTLLFWCLFRLHVADYCKPPLDLPADSTTRP
jgi:hypothetical protein